MGGDGRMTPRRVVIKDVDTARLLAVIEQVDDVIRELALVQIGMRGGPNDSGLPQAVLETMGTVRDVVFRPKEDISRQAAEAWAEGRARFDVAVDIEHNAGGVVRSVLGTLEQVDAVSVGDRALLIPAATPEVAAYRRWFFSRVADQLEDPDRPG